MSHDPATRLKPQSRGIPLPEPSPTSAPYWDGASVGKLMYQWCPTCALAQMDPRPACMRCQIGPLEWRESTGWGRISSFTVVWRPPVPDFETPYAPAIVELEEGFEVLSNIIDCAIADLAVGVSVRVVFHEIRPGRSLPYFSPDRQ